VSSASLYGLAVSARRYVVYARGKFSLQKYIRKNYAYCISFVTVKEIFGRLARWADEYFTANKAPLQLLYGSGKRGVSSPALWSHTSTFAYCTWCLVLGAFTVTVSRVAGPGTSAVNPQRRNSPIASVAAS